MLSLVRLERWLAERGVSRRTVLTIDLSLHALQNYTGLKTTWFNNA